MNAVAERFDLLRSRNEKAFVPFVTAGDPSLEDLRAILDCLQSSGADLIEVGIPFSDPIADGPTIQASSQRALDRGVTPRAVLEALSGARLEVPIVLMGYTNPILRMGFGEFARTASASGVSGVIVSDMIPEESGDWRAACSEAGIATVFLAAPTSTDERLDAVCAASRGFVYAVSRTGVTGAEREVPEEVRELVARLRSRTDLPVCVGFGISSAEQVRRVCEVADGAVVGSWLVNLLDESWKGGSGRAEIEKRVGELKKATQ